MVVHEWKVLPSTSFLDPVHDGAIVCGRVSAMCRGPRVKSMEVVQGLRIPGTLRIIVLLLCFDWVHRYDRCSVVDGSWLWVSRSVAKNRGSSRNPSKTLQRLLAAPGRLWPFHQHLESGC